MAVHSTVVPPKLNAEPDAGLHVTSGDGSASSDAGVSKFTIVPSGPLTNKSAIGSNVGAVVSSSVII